MNVLENREEKMRKCKEKENGMERKMKMRTKDQEKPVFGYKAVVRKEFFCK